MSSERHSLGCSDVRQYQERMIVMYIVSGNVATYNLENSEMGSVETDVSPSNTACLDSLSYLQQVQYEQNEVQDMHYSA